MKKQLPALLFPGAAWGICEATAGFLLHRAAVALPGLPGTLMFPVGFYWMNRAQKTTGHAGAAPGIAAVAALIKLSDLLMPGADPIRVINPALSILLEGLAFAALSMPNRAQGVPLFVRAFAMGTLWRALFASYLFAISLAGLPAGLVTSGLGILLRFVLLESFLNALIIQAGFLLSSKLPRRKPRSTSPAAAAAALMLALGLQALL